MKANELIDVFTEAVYQGWGYIWGTTHEMWTPAKQEEYAKKYTGDPDRGTSAALGKKWIGHWVTDCSGLFRYAFGLYRQEIAHGSNSIWDSYCTQKGSLRSGSRTDGKELKFGTAVFTETPEGKHNHIGLYIGDDVVVEARGCEAGVVSGRITNKKWAAWGELKGVDYTEGDDDGMKAVVVLPTGATGSTVNVRADESKKAPILFRVPVGATVEVVNDLEDWCMIRYNGKEGYMMSNYLEYEGQGGESGNLPEAEEIEACLRVIEAQVKKIRALMGG